MRISRLGAFLIHLGISVIIFSVLACVVLWVWYPDFYFASDGGWQGMRIIGFVDLVLGPLLTLVVFDRSKPRAELRRDLGIIGTVQAVCLVIGTWIVYWERPLALVYADGQFFSISADEYEAAGVDPAALSQIPGPYPKRVAVNIPEDPVEQSQVRRQAWERGQPIRTLVSRYRPLSRSLLDADREALDGDWLAGHEEQTGDLTRWLEDHGGSVDDYDFFRFGARYGQLVLGLDRSGEILGVLETPLRWRESPDAELQHISER